MLGNLPEMHWFAFVLLVLMNRLSHAFSYLADCESNTEAQMENLKARQVSTPIGISRWLSSISETMWAIGTSLAAGALSASVHKFCRT